MPSNNRGRHCKTWYSFFFIYIFCGPFQRLAFLVCYASFLSISPTQGWECKWPCIFTFRQRYPIHHIPYIRKFTKGPVHVCLMQHFSIMMQTLENVTARFHHTTKQIRSRSHLYLTNWPPSFCPAPQSTATDFRWRTQGSVRPPRVLCVTFFQAHAFTQACPCFFWHTTMASTSTYHTYHILYEGNILIYQVARNFFHSHDFTKACLKNSCKFCTCFFSLQ